MGENAIDPALIRRQLAQVSASPQFRTAGRLRDFLNFVVIETLAGRQQSIKEYTVGTLVYGRSGFFDPKQDSIVRVEAVKLRARLEAYYAQPEAVGQLVISMPKGGYVPEFRHSLTTVDRSRSGLDRIEELCDLGTFTLFRRTPAAIVAATRYFALARNLNPAESRAYVGLADAYVASLDIEAAPPIDVLGELQAAVVEGVRLNDASADAHVFASIYCATSAGLGRQTIQEARRALQLEPHSVMGNFWAAGLLSARGIHEAGIEHMREAARNAPFCTLVRAYLGRVLHYAGRDREALNVLEEVTGGDPTLAVGHMWTALALAKLDRHDQAMQAGLRAVELSETSATLSTCAFVFARAGRQQDAQDIWERLTTAPPHGYVSPLQLAAVAEALNQRENAARHLANAQRENAWGMIWHNVDPRLTEILSHS